MEGYVDPAPARVDHMKWADMQFIHAVIEDIRTLSKKHTAEEMQRHVNAVVTEIDDRFEGKLSPDTYHTIVLALRAYSLFVRGNDDETNKNQGLNTTQLIINFVQGDNKMDKNQLTSMTFRRVKEAIEKVALGHGPLPDLSGEYITTVSEEYAAKIVNDVFGGKTPAELQASTFVPQFYEMDPETDDVLRDGSRVIDGMKVLFEAASFRARIKDNMSEEEIYRARRLNRWCTVTERKLTPGGKLTFVAVYDDGVKAKRTEPIDTAWLVKKDSIPRIDTLMTLEGHLLDELPTAKMVEYLKDRIKVYPAFDARTMKIQAGIDGDVIPLEEYLVSEGVVAGAGELMVFSVVGPQGAVAFNGTKNQIVEFFKDMDEVSMSFYKVQRMGSQLRAVSAEKFLKDRAAKFRVWDEEGTEMTNGPIDEILVWAQNLPGDEPVDKYAGYSVSREGAVDGYTLEQFVAHWENR